MWKFYLEREKTRFLLSRFTCVIEGYNKPLRFCFWKEQRTFSFCEITSSNKTVSKAKNSNGHMD